jgi:hypothetical protein
MNLENYGSVDYFRAELWKTAQSGMAVLKEK